jgi:hypothetical protein
MDVYLRAADYLPTEVHSRYVLAQPCASTTTNLEEMHFLLFQEVYAYLQGPCPDVAVSIPEVITVSPSFSLSASLLNVTPRTQTA